MGVLCYVGEEVVVVRRVVHEEMVVEGIERVCGAVLLCPVDILPGGGGFGLGQMEVGDCVV